MIEHYLDRLANTIRENWDQPALTDFYLNEDGTAQDLTRGRRYTYGGMYQEIVRVANLLIGLGLQKGDHIAICGANSAHWVIAYLAIAKMQGVSVTVLHSLMPEDIARQIDFSDAKALFTDVEVWDELQSQPLPQIQHVIDLEDWSLVYSKSMFDRQSTDSQPTVKANVPAMKEQCQFVHGDPNELSLICFTSGSTGEAKGVMIPHVVHSVGGGNLRKLFPVPQCKKNALPVLPFGHVLGFADVNNSLYAGCNVYIIRSIVRPSDLVKIIMQIQPYSLMLTPMIVNGFMQSKSVELLRQCSAFLKYGIAGGAMASPEIVGKLRSLGFPITIAYGATETSLISSSSPETFRNGSCGTVVDSCTVRVAPNGEILVKGKTIMLGYYKDPEATAHKIDAEGWLHTGDKGHLDEDGYLYVEGRLDEDMIVLPNGENVHPETIEEKINAMPEVKESIVLARDGKLVAIVVSSLIENRESKIDLRRRILRTVNPELPLFCQLYDLELTDQPLARTEKQTLKRYLYK